MRGLMIVAATAAALLVMACGDDDDGADETVTPAASATAAEATETEAPAEPTEEATTAPDGAGAVTLDLSAANIAFSTASLSADAGADITVAFANNDSGIPHNVHFYDGPDAQSPSIGMTDIASGPAEQTLELGPLDAGEYFYKCDVHPNMNGTLTVGG